jgi:hypothetical protein
MSNLTENATDGHIYNPDNLLDELMTRMHFKNDAALSRALEIAPPLISKIRHRHVPVGGPMLIRMHEISGLSIEDLRKYMGDRREKFRISPQQFKPDSNESNRI